MYLAINKNDPGYYRSFEWIAEDSIVFDGVEDDLDNWDIVEVEIVNTNQTKKETVMKKQEMLQKLKEMEYLTIGDSTTSFYLSSKDVIKMIEQIDDVEDEDILVIKNEQEFIRDLEETFSKYISDVDNFDYRFSLNNNTIYLEELENKDTWLDRLIRECIERATED